MWFLTSCVRGRAADKPLGSPGFPSGWLRRDVRYDSAKPEISCPIYRLPVHSCGLGCPGGRHCLGDVFEESNLRAGLKDGGQVLGAFIVARSEEEFVIYMRASWGRVRDFRIIRTWRGVSDRTFKNLQSAWCFVRKFEFSGRVTVYPMGDPELRQFVGVMPRDLGPPPQLDQLARSMPSPILPDSTHHPTNAPAAQAYPVEFGGGAPASPTEAKPSAA